MGTELLQSRPGHTVSACWFRPWSASSHKGRLLRTEVVVYFKMVPFSLLLPEEQGNFSPVFTMRTYLSSCKSHRIVTVPDVWVPLEFWALRVIHIQPLAVHCSSCFPAQYWFPEQPQLMNLSSSKLLFSVFACQLLQSRGQFPLCPYLSYIS